MLPRSNKETMVLLQKTQVPGNPWYNHGIGLRLPALEPSSIPPCPEFRLEEHKTNCRPLPSSRVWKGVWDFPYSSPGSHWPLGWTGREATVIWVHFLGAYCDTALHYTVQATTSTLQPAYLPVIGSTSCTLPSCSLHTNASTTPPRARGPMHAGPCN